MKCVQKKTAHQERQVVDEPVELLAVVEPDVTLAHQTLDFLSYHNFVHLEAVDELCLTKS